MANSAFADLVTGVVLPDSPPMNAAVFGQSIFTLSSKASSRSWSFLCPYRFAQRLYSMSYPSPAEIEDLKRDAAAFRASSHH
jgi:hypothetical protein